MLRRLAPDFNPAVVAAIDARLDAVAVDHGVELVWAIESGSRSGPQRPYVATTRAVVLYLHHRLDEVDPDRDKNLRDIVALAAHPGTFLSSTVDADVRALYELLVPRLDGHPDKEEAAKVRELARKAAKRGRGWFGR